MTCEEPTFSVLSKLISLVITGLICLSVLTFVVETMPQLQDVPDTCDMDAPRDNDCRKVPKAIFYVIEFFCIAIFTIEYVARVATVATVPAQIWTIKPPKGALSGRDLTLRYMTRPMNVVDFVAITPFWVEVVFNVESSFSVLRIIRLTRMLRMLKSPSIRALVVVIKASIVESASALMILAFFSGMAIVLIGTLIFIAEIGVWTTEEEDLTLCCTEEQLASGDRRDCLGCWKRPSVSGLFHEASPFHSIPLGMYWVVVTMTTVGYGDLAPTTTAGRIIAIITTYCGIVALALPITVIGNNFTRAYDELREEQKRKIESQRAQKTETASMVNSVLHQLRKENLIGNIRGSMSAIIAPMTRASSNQIYKSRASSPHHGEEIRRHTHAADDSSAVANSDNNKNNNNNNNNNNNSSNKGGDPGSFGDLFLSDEAKSQRAARLQKPGLIFPVDSNRSLDLRTTPRLDEVSPQPSALFDHESTKHQQAPAARPRPKSASSISSSYVANAPTYLDLDGLIRADDDHHHHHSSALTPTSPKTKTIPGHHQEKPSPTGLTATPTRPAVSPKTHRKSIDGAMNPLEGARAALAAAAIMNNPAPGIASLATQLTLDKKREHRLAVTRDSLASLVDAHRTILFNLEQQLSNVTQTLEDAREREAGRIMADETKSPFT